MKEISIVNNMSSNRLAKVKGTKKLVHRNQLLVSLGLPSLDSIFGGGLPVGNIFLVEEDEFAVYSDILLKHYLAEGVISDHTLLLASLDADYKKLVSELPSPLHSNTNVSKSEDQLDTQLRIAWRYENLSISETADRNVPVFGNTYDLGVPIKRSIIDKVEIKRWRENESVDEYKDDYDSLLNYVRNALHDKKYKFDVPSEDRTALRIALISLGTGSWTGNIHKFLIQLRFLLRDFCATCYVSIQPSLFENMKDISRCEHLSDVVIQLKSLADCGNPTYDDYDGLIILKKLPSINNWAPIVPETNDWAFKMKKKRFIVEKLHISPELQEDAHRGDEEETRKILSNVNQQF